MISTTTTTKEPDGERAQRTGPELPTGVAGEAVENDLLDPHRVRDSKTQGRKGKPGEPRENRTHISPEAAGEQSGQPVQASLASELLGPAWEGSSEGKKFGQT